MEDVMICAECKKQTEVIYDHSSGDTVCSECSLVLDSHCIDTSAEWRTFVDDNNNHDPNRVGHASNPLLDTQLLMTSIEIPKGTKPGNFVNRYTGSGSSAANHLLTAFEQLRRMSDRLGLGKMIEESGCDIYKRVFYDENHKKCRRKNLDAALGACLLVACQHASSLRTVKEICSVIKDGDCNTNAEMKDVLKAKTVISKKLAEDDKAGIRRPISAGDIVKRFCHGLGINNLRVLKAAVEAASNCETEDVDVRRSPISVAATLIYVVVQLSDSGVSGLPLREIASSTNVAVGTIKNTYKDMYPYIRKIVPTWFATDVALDNLCAP